MKSEKPIYTLKVVLRETGIKPDVLRAWERRYGLPMPQRSAGGHRLYSQRDIAIIKWLIARQHEGLSISSAVELFREHEASSRNTLEDFETIEQPAQLTVFTSESTLDRFREKWLEACISFNEPAAEQILNQAFSLYPLEVVLTEVVQHGMRDLGERWYDGDTTVQQEHFTSALALRRIESLLTSAPSPLRPQTVMMACPSEEWHTFSLVLLNLLVRRRGYKVFFLGANVPIDRLNEAVNSIQPDLVILAAQHLTSAANLQKTARILSQNLVQVAYGGRVFNAIPLVRERIPGHFLGRTIEDSLQVIEQLLQAPKPIPACIESSPTYLELAHEFRIKRGLIENHLIEDFQSRGVPIDYLAVANLHLGNEIASVLELGEVDFLSTDMIWLKGLLIRHNVPEEQLNPYLMAYGESIQRTINGHSTILTKWINSLAEEK